MQLYQILLFKPVPVSPNAVAVLFHVSTLAVLYNASLQEPDILSLQNRFKGDLRMFQGDLRSWHCELTETTATKYQKGLYKTPCWCYNLGSPVTSLTIGGGEYGLDPQEKHPDKFSPVVYRVLSFIHVLTVRLCLWTCVCVYEHVSCILLCDILWLKEGNISRSRWMMLWYVASWVCASSGGYKAVSSVRTD